MVDTLAWVRRTQSEIESLNIGHNDLAALKASLTTIAAEHASRWRNLPPWEAGWEQARAVRSALQIE
jgi:hypothetical protein